MPIVQLHAAAFVADTDGSEDPMAGSIQRRRLPGGAGLRVVLDDADRAGRGNMTVAVPDMAAARSQFDSQASVLGDALQGDCGLIAQIHDPDGNCRTVADPPMGLDR